MIQSPTDARNFPMEARLNLETRHEAGKGVARKLRRAGRAPGIIYGGGGDTLLVSMEARDAYNLFQSISLDDTVLHLSVGDGATERAMVQEVQVHPYRPELLHVDFLRVGTEGSGGDNG